jgi:tetratricopeptide (TPR) repeat protein
VQAFVGDHISDAIEAFTRVIDQDPRHRLAYSSRGVAYLRMERVRDALKDFDQAVALSPGHAKSYHLRGLAHEKLGEIDQAVRDFDEAIRLDPAYGAAYYSRSTLLSLMGNVDQAFEYLQMYTSLTQKNLEEFMNDNNIWQSRQLHLEEMGAADVMDR